MKIFLLVILLTVVAAGLWQNQELSRLKERESVLRARAGGIVNPDRFAKGSGKTGPVAPEGRQSFDPGAFLKRFEELVGGGRQPSEREAAELLDSLVAASPRELRALVEELRRSNSLPQELKRSIFSVIAPRLAESQPKLAAEIAVEGGEENPFRAVMRVWLSRDAKTASSWVEEATAADPPFNETRFKPLEDFDLAALSLAARVIADPAGGGLQELLEESGKAQLAALDEVMMSSTPAELANVMHRISRDSGSTEKEWIELIGTTLARHRDPAVARQVLLDARLPEPEFIKAASILMTSADPSTMQTSVDWFLAATTDGPDRTQALERIWGQWSAKSSTEAEAYFRGRNLPVPKP
jgi:hypothetical protein